MAKTPVKQLLSNGFYLTVYSTRNKTMEYDVVVLEGDRMAVEFHAARRFTSRETKLGTINSETTAPCFVLREKDQTGGQFSDAGIILVQHKELANVLVHDDVKEPIVGAINMTGFKPGSFLAHMFESALMSIMRTDMFRMPVPVFRAFMTQVKKTSAQFAAKVG